DLRNKNTKLEKINVEISKELKGLKEDFSTLMEINDAFGTENEKLKRKIRASEIDDIESKHLSKKAKSKRSVVQISDDNDKDED
ncbi:19931_t:CDS:1, partial [Rhizophagus irregularis]